MKKYNTIRSDLKDLAITIFTYGTSCVYAKQVETKLSKINNQWKAICDKLGMTYKDAEETLFLLKVLQEMLTRLNTWLNHVHENIKKVALDSCCPDEMVQYVRNIEVCIILYTWVFLKGLKRLVVYH